MRIASGSLLCNAGSSNLVLCDNLAGWDGMVSGRRSQRLGAYVCLWLVHIDVWQKPTQYCKAIILHLKINKFKKKDFRKFTFPLGGPVRKHRWLLTESYPTSWNCRFSFQRSWVSPLFPIALGKEGLPYLFNYIWQYLYFSRLTGWSRPELHTFDLPFKSISKFQGPWETAPQGPALGRRTISTTWDKTIILTTSITAKNTMMLTYTGFYHSYWLIVLFLNHCFGEHP